MLVVGVVANRWVGTSVGVKSYFRRQSPERLHALDARIRRHKNRMFLWTGALAAAALLVLWRCPTTAFALVAFFVMLVLFLIGGFFAQLGVAVAEEKRARGGRG